MSGSLDILGVSSRTARFRTCQLFDVMLLGAALLLLACENASCADSRIYTVAQAANRIDGQLNQMKQIAPGDPGAVAATYQSITETLDVLRQKSVMIFGQKRNLWSAINEQMEAALKDWNDAVREKDKTRMEKDLDSTRKAWSAMKLQYPGEALQFLPPLWSCPMHPELLEREAGNCKRCGMPLEPVYVTQPQLTSEPMIRSEMIAGKPLQVGQKADLRLRLLFNTDGRSVGLQDLEETHTQKIHLLIIDLTETDYHHEHPIQLDNGEYGFSFVPLKPGVYRVWADLMPALTRIQQFSISDIPSLESGGQLQPTELENRHTELGNYRFDLSFEKPVLQEKDTVQGKLRVTDAEGKSFDQLEVVMGAFGHFVAFADDFSTVLHMHPSSPNPGGPDSRGGPELPFYFRSNRPGLVRLFTQVKIGGKDYFPRFVVRVQPLQHVSTR